MPISVTCPCGARLEIDEKFLGKEIPCPDCSRPLPTTAPPTPPPLDMPDHRRTSGLAVLSLALALVGAFTIVGTLAAIVVGVLALRQIAKQPGKMDGSGFARAGIITGAVCTFLTIAALISPTVLGLDQFLRELRFASVRVYPPNEKVETADGVIEIVRPSNAWAIYKSPTQHSEDIKSNDLILVNTGEDAYIACQMVSLEDEDNDKIENREKRVLDAFYKSELVNLIGRLGKKTFGDTGTVSERKAVPGKEMQEITVDVRLGGINRRFLIQYASSTKGISRLKATVIIGAARSSRFERVEDDFRKAFASFKAKNEI